jgi:LPS-assembly lipoprotein
MMRRRLLLTGTAALPLAGCGFQLRDAPELAFRSLFVNAGENSPVGNELKRNLASLGALTLIADPQLLSSADRDAPVRYPRLPLRTRRHGRADSERRDAR